MDFTTSPLVQTDWLAAHIDDADLRIVDARWRGDGSGRQLYLQGHLRGAIHLDWHADLNYTGHVPDLLLPPERFAAVMEANGIGDETRVVAYAETDYSGAARLWWALRYYGHDQVAVLDGGITRWLAEGRPLAVDVSQPAAARFTPRPQAHWLATATDVEAALAAPNAAVCLVDTRPPEQYAGLAVWTPEGSLYLPTGQDFVEVEGRRMRAGHIPGALHLHASRNLDPAANWTYLSAAALRAQAEAAGIDAGKQVILYCGVGISASLGLFALHLAGFDRVALYDASWAEWGTNPYHPVAR